MREHWHNASDGTGLFARDHGPQNDSALPLLCLPGLTRHGGDFEPVVEAFAPRRRVITMDFRGRGHSAPAEDPGTYRPDVELQDTLAFLDALGIHRVALLGTSRGGIVGLLMAALAPARLAGLMLNDVGCKLEPDGLLRIRGYVGATPVFKTWAAAATALKRASSGFAGVTANDWQKAARRIYAETDAGIMPRHDPQLALTFPDEDTIRAGNIPELWSLLPALEGKPFALLHGEGSDLLNRTTVQTMQQHAPHLAATTVPGRGHVPFLDEPESLQAIEHWLQRVDAAKQVNEQKSINN